MKMNTPKTDAAQQDTLEAESRDAGIIAEAARRCAKLLGCDSHLIDLEVAALRAELADLKAAREDMECEIDELREELRESKMWAECCRELLSEDRCDSAERQFEIEKHRPKKTEGAK